MELFIERIAQLVEAEAIAVLEAVPAPLQRLAFRRLTTWGTLVRWPLEKGLVDHLRTAEIAWLPPEFMPGLGLDPGTFRWFAAPIRLRGEADLSGAVLAAFHRSRSSPAEIKPSLDLLVSWTTHELAWSRELALARKLSARHVERREQERLSLATLIHDDLSQSLTSIRLTLATLQRQVSHGEFDRVAADLKDLVSASAETAESVQKLSTHLRPAIIETVGPASAIRHQAELHRKSSGIEVKCELEHLKMSGAAALAVFRIVEHSLENVVRHADASQVTIRLHRQGNEDVLEVHYNGRGFDFARKQDSLGLLSLSERAEMSGGRLSIESVPGKGTRVAATFPSAEAAGKATRKHKSKGTS